MFSFYNFSAEEFFYLRFFNFENEVSVKELVIYYDSACEVPDATINKIQINKEKAPEQFSHGYLSSLPV